MDYEKLYKEALERAKKLYEQGTITESISYIFPELAESEDERIKKRIIQALHGDVLDMGELKKCIAWLEKQGENKPFDYENINIKQRDFAPKSAMEAAKEEKIEDGNKVESKFHEGDWIIHKGTENVYQVVACIDNQYQLRYGDNYTIQKCNEVDRNTRLWTIKDAKPGDVLASKDGDDILIFRNLDTAINFSSYYNLRGKGELGWSNKNFIPSTKEQRDTLMKAMADDGYTFDFEKKELKKIENKNPMLSDFFKAEYERGKADSQKPTAWSEEDERNLKGIIDEIEANKNQAPDYDLATYDRFLSWLKSFKQRIG